MGQRGFEPGLSMTPYGTMNSDGIKDPALYTHHWSLLVIQPNGVKKMGEIELAVGATIEEAGCGVFSRFGFSLLELSQNQGERHKDYRYSELFG
ncbi:unnamed protein product [Arabis nemorensis]|uniref:Uncharacterized protein n=1 Tax=Arabis nemorensis TaxID=586526 RepID=A0A565BMU9_9BRAS|nr:unnamed protein product [Arabis nemorensis]